MKRVFRNLGVLLVAPMLLASCLGDGDTEEITPHSDVAITSFTLGTLNRDTHTTSSTTGNDTIIRTTLTGSDYKMTIDQLGHQIYNQTSLPLGTDIKHVVCTVVSKNSGWITLKSMTSDSLSWYSSTDSIDFSQPRTFRIFAIDNSGYRDYTVTLNVNATEGLDFGWTKMKDDDALAGWTAKKLVPFADTVKLVDDGVVMRAGKGYRINGQGYVEASEDLENWSLADGVVYTNANLKQLLGASSKELYALGNDGMLKVSADAYAKDWANETLDEAASLLPANNIAMISWPYASANNTDYVLMVGDASYANNQTSVWRKLSCYDTEANNKWVFMGLDDSNRYTLPVQEHLSLTCYNGHVLAIGDAKTIYESRDQGLTWREESIYQLPTSVQGTQFSMTTDSQGRLWVITNSGQLWKGYKK